MTDDEEFVEELSIVVKENAETLLLIPGVFEVLSEYFNNEVLERIETRKLNESDEPEERFWVDVFPCDPPYDGAVAVVDEARGGIVTWHPDEDEAIANRDELRRIHGTL